MVVNISARQTLMRWRGAWSSGRDSNKVGVYDLFAWLPRLAWNLATAQQYVLLERLRIGGVSFNEKLSSSNQAHPSLACSRIYVDSFRGFGIQPMMRRASGVSLG